MKSAFLPLALACMLLVSAASCHKDDDDKPDNASGQPYTPHFRYYDARRIDSFTNTGGTVSYFLTDGPYRVFEYTLETGYDDQTPDNEYTAYLRWQVDSSLTAFDIHDDTLALPATTAYYFGGGAWGGYPPRRIHGGFVKGHRSDAMHFQVEFEASIPIADPQTGKSTLAGNGLFQGQ